MADEVNEKSREDLLLVAEVDGQRVAPVEQVQVVQQQGDSSLGGYVLEPMLINFPQWVKCNVVNDSEYVLATYTWNYNGTGKPIDLKCGTSGFGYKHITEKHESQWQDKWDSMKSQGWDPSLQGMQSWDDLMSFSAIVALDDVGSAFRSSQVSQKACTNVQLYLVDSNGTPKYSLRFEVVWSLNNSHIITAYPSQRTTCNA
jgi:hypothetical protein